MNLTALATAISILTALGASFAVAICASKGAEAIARQPEKEKAIRNLSFLGMVLAEACAIYGLLVALMLFSKL